MIIQRDISEGYDLYINTCSLKHSQSKNLSVFYSFQAITQNLKVFTLSTKYGTKCLYL